MTIVDFIQLDQEEKKLLLLHGGILIGKRWVDDHIVFLFQLQSFYIEVYCNPQNKKVEEYLAFEGTTPLYPYLQTIQIDHLFEPK